MEHQHENVNIHKQQQGQLSVPAQRLDFHLLAFHILTDHWRSIKTLLSLDMYLGHKVFRVRSDSPEYWKDCSKIQ